MRRQILIRSHFVLVCIAVFCLLLHTKAFGEALFKDPNGYFTTLVPDNWTRQDYPEETIRSKVAFHHPKENGVYIRIISTPTAPSYTLDEYYDEIQDKINNVSKKIFPGMTWKIKRDQIGKHQAVIVKNPGGMEIVMLIQYGVSHNISFNWNTYYQFEQYHEAFRRFVINFIPMEPDSIFSEKDVNAGSLARAKRLAKLLLQMGRREDALKFIREGLTIDPKDSDLRRLKKQLDTKQLTR